MTATERDHLREGRFAYVDALIHQAEAEYRVWHAQYDLWNAGGG